MLMQMLKAGGFDVGVAVKPYYEDDRATKALPHDHTWLKEYDGKTVKVLNPDVWLRKHSFEDLGIGARCIWIEREDRTEQARSWQKFLRSNGHAKEVDTTPFEALVHQLGVSLDANKQVVADLDPQALHLSFEQTLEDPLQTALALKAWLWGEKDFGALAASRVVRRRGPECLDYLLEERL
jgi:hypothetical protein